MFRKSVIREYLRCSDGRFNDILKTVGLYSPFLERLYTPAEARRIMLEHFRRLGEERRQDGPSRQQGEE